MRKDLEHLKLLAIFYYIMAGLTFLMGSFFILYFFIGLAMVSGTNPAPPPGPGAPPRAPKPATVQRFMGWMFLIFGGVAVLFGWAIALAAAIAGRCLQRHRGWTFCFVVACILCMNVPLGTTLGVFTILVLVRPTVKDLFAGKLHLQDPEDDEGYGDLDDREEDEPPEPLSDRRDDDRYSDSPRGKR
jgi:hypothetical protein